MKIALLLVLVVLMTTSCCGLISPARSMVICDYDNDTVPDDFWPVYGPCPPVTELPQGCLCNRLDG
jgi:hypothetical protein